MKNAILLALLILSGCGDTSVNTTQDSNQDNSTGQTRCKKTCPELEDGTFDVTVVCNGRLMSVNNVTEKPKDCED